MVDALDWARLSDISRRHVWAPLPSFSACVLIQKAVFCKHPAPLPNAIVPSEVLPLGSGCGAKTCRFKISEESVQISACNSAPVLFLLLGWASAAYRVSQLRHHSCHLRVIVRGAQWKPWKFLLHKAANISAWWGADSIRTVFSFTKVEKPHVLHNCKLTKYQI